MKKHQFWIIPLSALTSIIAAPAISQDDSAAAAAAAAAAETRRLEDRADREKQRLEDRADIKELLAAAKTNGGTTKSDSAGSMEANLLTRNALVNAAAKLDQDVVNGVGPVLILVDDEKLGTWDLDSVSRRFDFVKSQIEIYRASIGTIPACKPVIPNLGPPVGGVAAAIPIISGLLGILQQKTELGNATVTVTSDMLARVVAGRLLLENGTPEANKNQKVQAYLLDDIPYLDLSKSKLHTDLLTLDKDATCLRDFAATFKPDPKKPAQVAQAAAMKAVLDRYDTFMTEINKADDAGESSLFRALRQDAIKTKVKRILRIKVESAGGTTLNRNNFFTLFGVPAVSVTGGIVISYVFTDTATNDITASGVMACPTTLARLSKIHSGAAFSAHGDASKCY